MQQVIFETSPAFILLCIAAGIGYAWLLYTTRHPWTKALNRLLFGIRALLVFLVAFLLLGPIVRQVINHYEKPVFAIVFDNSGSVKESLDSLTLQGLWNNLAATQEQLRDKGFETTIVDLDGNALESVQMHAHQSDLNSALRKVAARYEGRSLAGALLVSDGIYNQGLSPLYSHYAFPVYTLGMGDTTQRADVAIKNLAYNKIAYQGNRFPVRAEVLVKGFAGQSLTISLKQKGRVVEKQTLPIAGDQLLIADFLPSADEQGIQRYEVEAEIKTGERNVRNNRATAFVEVVAGKKKILMVAAAPHPDIKALRSVIEKNSNYEFMLHIPGVEETSAANLQPANCDLVIFHQSPDLRGRTRELFTRFSASPISRLIVVGQQTDMTLLMRETLPTRFEQLPRQYDEVTPLINPTFSPFRVSPEAITLFATFPPVSVHFGKMQTAPGAQVLLYQRVGSLTTDKPLLAALEQDGKKSALLLGEGWWRWRLQEYSKSENTNSFDEVIGKLIQYLGTTEDKNRFKSYPVKQEFSDSEPVVFESQVYNDIYEPVYGNTIDIEITSDVGTRTVYQYVTSPGSTRYQMGGLQEGVYRYRASTSINGTRADVRGQFLVSAQQAELQNLTADYSLLRKLAATTGGTFASIGNQQALDKKLLEHTAVQVIQSDETYDSVINLPWVFVMLLLLATGEWFLRKFYGSY